MSEQSGKIENFNQPDQDTTTEEESVPVLKEDNEGSSMYTLSAITEQITAIHLPAEIKEKWKNLLVSMRVVDNRIDNINDENKRTEFVSNLNLFLDGGEVDFSYDDDLKISLNRVRDLLNGLPDDRKRFTISSLKRILKITEEIKNEKNVSEFTDMTRLEGQMTAKIFLQFLPEEFIESGEYHKLMQAFTRLGRAGNSFDTLVDLRGDYNDGQTLVKPTPLNRLLILGAVITDGLSFLNKVSLSPELLRGLLKTSKKTIRNKLNKRQT